MPESAEHQDVPDTDQGPLLLPGEMSHSRAGPGYPVTTTAAESGDTGAGEQQLPGAGPEAGLGAGLLVPGAGPSLVPGECRPSHVT